MCFTQNQFIKKEKVSAFEMGNKMLSETCSCRDRAAHLLLLCADDTEFTQQWKSAYIQLKSGLWQQSYNILHRMKVICKRLGLIKIETVVKEYSTPIDPREQSSFKL